MQKAKLLYFFGQQDMNDTQTSFFFWNGKVADNLATPGERCKWTHNFFNFEFFEHQFFVKCF